MKKLILIFLILLSRGVYSQLAPSTIGQIYNFTVGDTLEYSFSSIQAIYNCGPSGLILDVIKSYTRTNDSIIYVVERLSSVAEYPCPNYNPPYGVFFDSTTFVQKLATPDSSIYFRVGICTGAAPICYDSTYIAGSGNFIGQKVNEYYSGTFSSVDDIWIDSLGLVHSYSYMEGEPSITNDTDLVYYSKATTGQRWGTFQSFPDYSTPLGVADLIQNVGIELYPNPSYSEIYVDALACSGNLHFRDLSGRDILMEPISNGKYTVDCHAWSRGMYLWVVEQDGVIEKCGKMVVE